MMITIKNRMSKTTNLGRKSFLPCECWLHIGVCGRNVTMIQYQKRMQGLNIPTASRGQAGVVSSDERIGSPWLDPSTSCRRQVLRCDSACLICTGRPRMQC